MNVQNELRKAALEREGGDASKKVVLPGKDDAKDPRVLDVDHLTQTQVPISELKAPIMIKP